MRSRGLFVAAVLSLSLASAGPAPGQDPSRDRSVGGTDPVDPAAGALARIPGAYRLADGRLGVVWDVVDQMPEGRHQLVWMEPASGRLRTLHPTSDTTFSAGPRWFVESPRELAFAFHGDRAAPAARVTLREGAAAVTGARIALREREVTFESGGATLSGSLILPPGGTGREPFGGVVMIPGSGRLTRRTPRYVARQYAARGVAALVYDKRGTGRSGGAFPEGGIRAFATDAAAAVGRMKSLPEVDGARTGVMASSQGGLVLPLLLERGAEVAFVVCRVCPVVSFAESRLLAVPGEVRAAGLPPGEVVDAAAWTALLARFALGRGGSDPLRELDRATASGPWREASSELGWSLPPDGWEGWGRYRSYLGPDPLAMYRSLRAPVLVILGEYDRRVPGGIHATLLRRALQRAGHPDFEVRVLPGASHGLMEVEFDGDGERRPFRRFVPGWHDRMVEWVVERTR